MSVNGITDVVVTVSVPKPEYEELVRDSETLNIIKRVVETDQYVTAKDIKILLGVEEGEKA